VSVAAALVAADFALRAGLAGWSGAGAVPAAVARPALREQQLELRLADEPGLAKVVLARLPARLARDVRDDVLARRELARLGRPRPLSAFRVGRALPANRLRAIYLEAARRSGVPWNVLAAVNFVESDFGRVDDRNPAGGHGPMQFLPATWARYGRGDVHDPRAAVLAAARLLRAAGAPARMRAALRRYNGSAAYADAVIRFAARIRREPSAFLALYARQVIVRTPSGYRRVTRFGL
jgi:hypothetical protein